MIARALTQRLTLSNINFEMQQEATHLTLDIVRAFVIESGSFVASLGTQAIYSRHKSFRRR
jgi:hypothetical protein